MAVSLKRIYEQPKPTDGTRVLVDRIWPRGVSKDQARLDAWLRELAPSSELRKLLHADAESWPRFRKLYLKELTSPQAGEALEKLHSWARRRKKLTLLFASKDAAHNNAVVLRDLLEGVRKPPTGTGPGALKRARQRQAKAMPR